MIARIWSKGQTQDVIKFIRKEMGQTVTKTSAGLYECKINGELVFAAMPGSRGYLVRYDVEKLYEAAA